MSLTFRAKVGKKRILVIPKRMAELLGLSEGSMVKITAFKDKMMIEPIRDAVWLSIHGEKVARLSGRKNTGSSRRSVLADTNFLLPAMGVEVEREED